MNQPCPPSDNSLPIVLAVMTPLTVAGLVPFVAHLFRLMLDGTTIVLMLYSLCVFVTAGALYLIDLRQKQAHAEVSMFITVIAWPVGYVRSLGQKDFLVTAMVMMLVFMASTVTAYRHEKAREDAARETLKHIDEASQGAALEAQKRIEAAQKDYDEAIRRLQSLSPD